MIEIIAPKANGPGYYSNHRELVALLESIIMIKKIPRKGQACFKIE